MVGRSIGLLESDKDIRYFDELPRRANRQPLLALRILVGHFVGGQLSYVGYDLGSRTRRYDGRAYGIGFSYGYAWMLSKRWFVILEAGIGLYRTRDTRRDPTVGDWDDEYIYHYRRWTLAPSRLEVSFSYLF